MVLSEDEPAIRERLSNLISAWKDGMLLASCGTLAETIDAINNHELDLLITDLNLPDGNGIEAIQALRTARPEAQAMVISVLADERTVLNSIEAGATGYLLKDADFTDLIEAITDLMAGRSPISSRIARILVKRLSATSPEASIPEGGPRLTDREMDILWGISKGFTYAELAQRLEISRQTVPVHIRNIYRKLQVSNRSEAVFEAARQGLIKL
nr:response regulator transcription factor [Martelella alba]